MNREQLDAYKDFAREKLGFEFNDIQLLVTALTHRSYVNEHKKSVTEHNERLEFLGDAVLELATSDFLYRNYDEPEGIMTSWRAALVRTESIAEAGIRLGYEPLVRLSKGEKRGSERAHAVILADCFEAVIGAIYLDHGYKQAEKFIHDNILVKIDEILKNESWRDAKSHLQEVAQHTEGVTPVYKVLKEDGPDHDKIFTLGVFIGNKLKGTGAGHSKQVAQVEAAERALLTYKKEAKS
ncbi:MAG: ribonuclease III [Candidatus Nomurabacteria bacterium]|jgi:ribonuclease-3|nr:ribonuclease III [Candidatus Nomurabacteria bacterium]